VGGLLLAHGVSAHAACDSTDSCLRAIEAAQSDTRTISARFTQTKHLSLLDEPLVSTGRFVFQRPDHMRLEIESPRSATILIRGRDISIPGISESDKQQLAMTPMAAMFSELGAMFSGAPAQLRQHFAVTATPIDNGIQVTLTPTVPEWQKLFRTIQLRFAGADLLMSTMHLDDALGDQLDIVMSDVRRNQPLPANAFELQPTPPK
jgi:outer membrane lipoprotein-sorting protein